jgi:hypothetical protein
VLGTAALSVVGVPVESQLTPHSLKVPHSCPMAGTPLDDTLPVATIAPDRGVRQIVAPPYAVSVRRNRAKSAARSPTLGRVYSPHGRVEPIRLLKNSIYDAR